MSSEPVSRPATACIHPAATGIVGRRGLLVVGAAPMLLLPGLTGVGLPGPVEAATEGSPAGVTSATQLTVAAFPAVDEMIKAALPAFRRLHPGVTVKVISRQFVDHHTAMTTALSTSAYLPDVMALEVGYVGRFSRGGGLEDLALPPYELGRSAAAFVPYAYAQGRGRGQAQVAAPLDIGPGTLLYRSDLLAQAGLAEGDLTTDWDGYIAAGRRLNAATGAYLVAHAREVKDILIRSGTKPGEGLYFDRDSRVLVNSPRFARAFELAREVRRHRLDGRLSAWSNDWSEAFRRGRLATQMTGAWLAGHLNNWLAPDTRGRWRAAPLPGGTQVAFGGSFLAIPRGAKATRKPLAWDLIRLMTQDAAVQIDSFRRHDAFPALLATHGDAFFDQPIPFLGGQPARQLWRETARHIQALEVHKQDAFAAEVIDTELDKVLDRAKPIPLALADAERLLARRALR
ncbi:MAG: hypothetical protein RL722_239 [Pseudomonadota bacterium]|jgi:multiple sugar transport system substrate-binding protein